MKASEVRNLTNAEIEERIAQELDQMVTLHFQHASSQLTDTSKINKARRDVARMKTVLNEREISGEKK
ncbi:MAG: 50S ribosomal protein L29 [Bacteroidia bacterium]|nr:50S ribosomal protein L29 [Bacteroidia bacterium]